MILLSLSTAKMAMPIKKSDGSFESREVFFGSQDESQGVMIPPC